MKQDNHIPEAQAIRASRPKHRDWRLSNGEYGAKLYREREPLAAPEAAYLTPEEREADQLLNELVHNLADVYEDDPNIKFDRTAFIRATYRAQVQPTIIRMTV